MKRIIASERISAMKRIVTPRRASVLGIALGGATLSFAVGASSRSVESEMAAVGSAAAIAGSSAAAGGAHVAGLGAAWDLPNLDHERIDFWVARFDTVPDMREKFQGFLDRGGEFAPMILERLEARGMPLDLIYLAMIESGFQTNATSHAAAVGVWQFIPATGQRFGLALDRAVDERRDPVRSTEAALDYLEFLYNRFGSWYLAAAAYNTGEGRVGRIMRQEFGQLKASSEEDYYRIWSRLPAETRDYVPLMIAAARITKDPAAYGFRPMQMAPRKWEEVTAAPATPLRALAAQYGTTVEKLRLLNPQFLIERTPNNREYPVRVPAGSLARAAQGGAPAHAED
jgi:membrane-bound lytic murein transglycosylase D